ncbi:hypothetical protein C8J57DRAFT_1327246 [Mycena rebaudengoi]|nr:hypothetical protein C8J57DRAFT_1327246 [Mycena rebaudengoi]
MRATRGAGTSSLGCAVRPRRTGAASVRRRRRTSRAAGVERYALGGLRRGVRYVQLLLPNALALALLAEMTTPASTRTIASRAGVMWGVSGRVRSRERSGCARGGGAAARARAGSTRCHMCVFAALARLARTPGPARGSAGRRTPRPSPRARTRTHVHAKDAVAHARVQKRGEARVGTGGGEEEGGGAGVVGRWLLVEGT